MVNGKNVVCPICSKHFGSAAAASQHRLAKHNGQHPRKVVAVPNVAAPTRRRARRTRRTGNAGGAPVSVGLSIKSQLSDTATLSGVDRFATVAEIKNISSTTLVNELVVPGSFLRLQHVAKAFQRIRYNYLRFRIAPQISTSTSGGYVAAFIRDPADEPQSKASGSRLLDYLTAQQHSVTTKWWQNASIDVPVDNQVYYTSESVEIREYSPGRFVLAADGKATQSGNLTVFCEWSVTLSKAALESDKSVEKAYTALVNIFTVSGSARAAKRVGSTATVAKASELMSHADAGAIFKLPWPVSMMENGTTNIRNVWYLKVDADGYAYFYREDENDAMGAVASEILVCFAGTKFDRVDQPPAADFLESSSRSPPPIDESKTSGRSDSLRHSTVLTKLLSELLLQLSHSKEPSSPREEKLPWRGSSRSMVSRRRSEGSLHMTSSYEELERELHDQS